jgi:hypothetical protein
MHFERLKINLAVVITGSEIAVLIWRAMAMDCFKGCDNVLLYDFEELERIDKGLAPFTSWEDVWLVGLQLFIVSVNVFGCSIDDVLKALVVLLGSAGLAIAILSGRWWFSAPGSSAHSTNFAGQKVIDHFESLLLSQQPHQYGCKFESC